MRIAADTHVHLYPFYDLAKALNEGWRNVSAFGAEQNILMLTERADCHVFEDLKTGRLSVDGWDIRSTKDADAIEACADEGVGRLILVAGRQIVTRERIEVLALATTAEFHEGLPIDTTLTQVREAGGLTVLSWAPGKWFFKRGVIVRNYFEHAACDSMLAGDTTLRPTCWGTPSLFNVASSKGLKIVAGSDPLPFAGEERYVGTYATSFDANFDQAHPSTSMRALLSDPAVKPSQQGRRCGLMETLVRLKKNSASARRMR